MSSLKYLIQFVKDNAEIPPTGVKKIEDGQANANVMFTMFMPNYKEKISSLRTNWQMHLYI